ncbi:MAG TPA: ATP-binding cassette domain-containing protein [Rhizomicrobium sp.]
MVPDPLFEIENASVAYERQGKSHRAVEDASISVAAGECVGIVGESGSGKSSLALAAMGLVPFSGGAMRFRGTPVVLRNRHDRLAWARRCHLVFQDPQASLDPRFAVWDIVTEPLAIAGMKDTPRRARAQELLQQVGLAPEHAARRPHEFSGGQRQRIAIARGIASHPALLILDEPTSALDMSVQAQVLNLLLDLQQRLNLAYLFISHDIAVIGHMCHRVAVMKDGRIVEQGPVREIFGNPQHPYTRALLAAAPRMGRP